MTRQPRDLPAEKAAIENAARRLLAGAPLRSASGGLTVTELIIESGLRRDVVYGDHRDLVDLFRSSVQAQNSTPAAMKDLTEDNADLTQKLAAARTDLTRERAAVAALRRLVVELSLELERAREEHLDHANVVRITPRADPRLVGPC